jgi:hypothetical protein
MLAGNSEIPVLTRAPTRQTLGAGTTEIDSQKIGYLIKNEDRPDIEAFLESTPALIADYIPVGIIGEGEIMIESLSF